MSASAGRVLLIPKGAYDASVTYHMLDMVTYNGSSYICKQTTTGNIPTNTTYWMLNASGSAIASIDEIGDVTITNPTDGQVLKYNSTTQEWENGTIATDLAGLTDVDLTSLADGDILKYNSTSQKWENAEDAGGLLPHLIISAPTGSTVTATKGTTVITAVETSSGIFECDIPEYGNWTISDGTDSSITPVNVVGALKVSIVNGSTIVPTDDIEIWLKCGARYENYTTMSEVLADTTCLSALMASQNAVDYMFRSTSFITSICGDDNAMLYIGLNNYCANKLLSDLTDWMPAICDSQYFERVLNVKVPVMTDNTTPSGECDGYFATNTYLIFDGNENTACNSGEVTYQINVEYKFPSVVKIFKVMVLPWLYNGTCTLSTLWTECKLDTEANWTRVYTITLGSGQTTKKYWRLNAPAEYNNFRLVSSGWNSNARRGFKEVQFYGRIDV